MPRASTTRSDLTRRDNRGEELFRHKEKIRAQREEIAKLKVSLRAARDVNIPGLQMSSKILLKHLTSQVKRDFKAKVISVGDSKIIREFVARFVHDIKSST